MVKKKPEIYISSVIIGKVLVTRLRIPLCIPRSAAALEKLLLSFQPVPLLSLNVTSLLHVYHLQPSCSHCGLHCKVKILDH